jgi:putative MATE family efflux protein
MGNSSMKEKQSKYEYLTTAPVEKCVFRMAIPTMISMLVTMFYNMTDTFFVGRINTSATAAVGVVFSLMALLQACSFFFGHGSGNFISRKLGEQNLQEATEMAVTGFVLTLVFAVLVAVFGCIFIEPLARFLGSTDTILPYATTYMRIILIGAPFIMGSFVLNNQLRFQGNAFYGMLGIVSGAVLNIMLDPILIFGMDMGIRGAGYATMLSQAVGFFILLTGTVKRGAISMNLRYFRLKGYYLTEICKTGFPSLCRQGLNAAATICLNQVAGGYSDAVIAAMSIVARLQQFSSAAVIGFGQGYQPVFGFNYGAGKYDRVKKAFRYCVKMSTIFLCVMTVIGFAFAPQLVRLFRDDADVTAVGTVALRILAVTFPVNGFIVTTNMTMQSAGKSIPATFLASARQGIFYIPLLFLLEAGFGVIGIELCQPIADVLTFLVSLPFGIGFYRKIGKTESS